MRANVCSTLACVMGGIGGWMACCASRSGVVSCIIETSRSHSAPHIFIVLHLLFCIVKMILARLAPHRETSIPISVGLHCETDIFLFINLYDNNKMKLVSIVRTPGQKKEFKATFTKPDGRTKTTRFGTSSNYLLNKDKDEQDRQAYIARHKPTENWKDPTSAGALSRFILWSPTRSLSTAIRDYKKRFKL